MPTAKPEDSIARMRAAAARLKRQIRLMEVCGTHTHAIGRGGLRPLFPENVDLISGPGCPVCVTSQSEVERMILLARQPALTVCTFGDMMRVPGVNSSLEKERSNGADIRAVYSPIDALDLAAREPERQVVFLGVGFETTAPGVAAMLLDARKRGMRNLSVYVSQKLVLPAMVAALEGESLLNGFVTPGHVSVIIGAKAYEEVAQKYKIPCVAAGFEPADMLEAVAMLLKCLVEGRTGSFIQYHRAVNMEGNPRARAVLGEVFEPGDAEWRGLGVIPMSGLILRQEFGDFDAVKRFNVPKVPATDLAGCRCGEVLRGAIHPPECPMFGKVCTPRNPLGPCMVSSEGSCAARYRYG